MDFLLLNTFKEEELRDEELPYNINTKAMQKTIMETTINLLVQVEPDAVAFLIISPWLEMKGSPSEIILFNKGSTRQVLLQIYLIKS